MEQDWFNREMGKCNQLIQNSNLRDIERHHILSYLRSLEIEHADEKTIQEKYKKRY